ncbi:helix-turn-helix domain-containing protein [Azospirillum agricola]|uniref:helix-turn-helix domain-containing protein n=1 Tax=Azospirillum agricola TaxID=1720247 RepID=UPI000A1CBD97|nr:helix-turn-helix domain-containing protein [Azospirillum agricola]
MTDLCKHTTAERPAGERWGRIPAWWLDHPDLDADGLAVLAALSTFADEAGVCWPSQATLAAKLKRSRPTVNRILGRLEALGLVAIEHRSATNGGRLSCRYRLSLSPIASRDSMPCGRTPPDSGTDSPCPAASQEQPHPEQIPDSLSSGAPGGHPRASRRPDIAVARTVPADWIPGDADRLWAASRFPDADLDAHAELFVRRCQAHGYRYHDVGAAWRSWLLQDMPKTAPRASHTRKTVPSVSAPAQRAAEAEQRVSAWASVAAQLNGSLAHAVPTSSPCPSSPPSSPWM